MLVWSNNIEQAPNTVPNVIPLKTQVKKKATLKYNEDTKMKTAFHGCSFPVQFDFGSFSTIINENIGNIIQNL